jgi:ferredoxin
MPTVTFTNLKKKIEVPVGANLRTAGLQNGIPMHEGIHKVVNCFGNGMCASCRVCIKSGEQNLRRKTWWEKVLMILNPEWLFARIGHEKDLTLACQTKVMGDCEVEATPPMNWHGEKFWS